MPRVLLVLPTATYRAADFLDAASSLGAEVVVASEEDPAFATSMGDRFVRVDLCDPAAAAEQIVSRVSSLDAVVGVDEQGVIVAAEAASRLGLRHNPPDAVAVTRDKSRMRKVLTEAGLPQPRFEVVGPDTKFQAGLSYVIKSVSLSGSRGVIRADTPGDARATVERVRAIAGDGEVLAEEFVPGAEVAVEGLLRSGHLDVLAIFDKPDPLDGPYFEETIYVTPSRLPGEVQDEIARTVQLACAAIGLVEGPIHAELRVDDEHCVLLEVAARSIGGLCSRALRFGAGISLEEVILRHALGLSPGDLRRTEKASGVMMIPIPRSGVLRAVDGREEAGAVVGIEGLEITVPTGHRVVALPEGDRYLGFLFATGSGPAEAEHALRVAHSKLKVSIDQ